MVYSPIGELAAIGNCLSVALVSTNGSVDWWCPERFDQAPVFAALLDDERGGRFQICPVDAYTTRRRYVGATNVLETTFVTPNGSMRLTDFMPLATRADTAQGIRPPQALVRVLDGIDGDVDVGIQYEPRFAYGRVASRISDRRSPGFYCEHRGDALAFRSDMPLRLSPDERSVLGRFVLRSGMRQYLSTTFARNEPLISPPLGSAAAAELAATLAWWKSWVAKCTYRGPFAEAVRRSALVLKLLAYAPSGAIVAAATTSLPEEIGGVRNWDYRYCWLRDATMTMRALVDLGFEAEARAFLAWLLHATRLTWPKLQVVYDVFGRTRLPEHCLDHLAGYEGSRPVRIGNSASKQFQLDVYGEVVGAAWCFADSGRSLSAEQGRLLAGLGETVCKSWREPDEGMWEVRSGRRQHTHSKVMCWFALDRLLALDEAGRISVPRDKFIRERDAIRAAIESSAFRPDMQSYVSVLGGGEVDASLLTMALHGYIDPGYPRMRSTHARILEQLSVNGLMRRYARAFDDGVPGMEAAFGLCSFWAVHYRTLLGEVDRAVAEFEHVLSFANDVGLFAEEIDPESGGALGNFPQAFTHVGLINAAVALSRSIPGAGEQ